MNYERIAALEREVAALKERNSRVEAEKAWETSNFRVGTIAIITYLVALVLLSAIGVENALAAAALPSLGYVLSTFSIPALKRWWMR